MVQLSQSPIKTLSYSFSRSPAKDLAAINEMMRSQGSIRKVGKRLLQDEEENTSKRILLDTAEPQWKQIAQSVKEGGNGQ